MEPTLTTAPHLVAVLEELKQREPIFHRPELGTGRRVTRRATLWRRSATGWKILYHQGTLVDPAS